jgi:hypothetical protein
VTASDYSDDADLEETGSFAAGSVRFLSPEIKLPSGPGFSPGSTYFPAESEDSAFAAEPEAEPAVEPWPEPEPEAAVGPESALGTFDTFDTFEPSAPFEPDTVSPEPEPVLPEPEAVLPEPEPEYRARPEFSDVFTRPAFIGKPDLPPEAPAGPEPAPEPLAPEAQASAEPEDSLEQEVPAASESGPSAASSDVFTRPEYTAKPDYSSFFTRPAFFPASEGDDEQPKPVEEPRYSPLGESRYPVPGEAPRSFSAESRYPRPQETPYPAPEEPRSSFSERSRYPSPQEAPYSAPAESRYPSPGEPPRSFSAESRYSGPKETRYTVLDDPRFSAPGEPPAPEESRPSFSGGSRYSGPAETPYSAPDGPRFSPLAESRYTGPKEHVLSRPEGSPIPAAPSRNGTATAAEPVNAETPEPAATVEVSGKPADRHPVRTTGELSVLRSPERPVGIESRLPDVWGYDGYPVVENTQPVDDQAGIVSLGYIGAAIRRKKKIWVLTTALGVLVAGALYATHKATYTNTTTVQLALNPNLDAATALQTDAILAEDSTMAQLAMQKLGLHETVPAFLKTYTVTLSTTASDLLTFTATAATPNAAYNETNTLATTFLQYRAQTELEKESANTAAQDQQVTQTQQQVSQLNSQIKKLKNEGVSTTDSRLVRLQSDLSTAQTLLASLQSNVASANATQRSATAQLIAGSSVLDTGIPAEGVSKKKFAIEYGGGAIFGGLVIGLLIVAIGAILSDRLRRRDDVAAALGAPVRVSVASGGKRARKANREADLKRVAAHLGAAVPSDSEGSGSLVVVAVDGKKFISEAIRELAVATAKEGKRVVVADLAGGALGQSFGTKEPGIRGVDVAGTRMVLVTPDRGDLAPVGPLHAPLLGTPMNGIQNVQAAADLFITLATVNPATGGAHLKTWADEAVAVVTAGESSVTRVQAVGEMIRFAGADLTSAILLGADQKDESLGYATV